MRLLRAGLTRSTRAALSECASAERDVVISLAVSHAAPQLLSPFPLKTPSSAFPPSILISNQVMCALCAEDLGMANSAFAQLAAPTALKTPLINFVTNPPPPPPPPPSPLPPPLPSFLLPLPPSFQECRNATRSAFDFTDMARCFSLQVQLTLLTVEKNAAPLYRFFLALSAFHFHFRCYTLSMFEQARAAISQLALATRSRTFVHAVTQHAAEFFWRSTRPAWADTRS
jgi:hypothetical protein